MEERLTANDPEPEVGTIVNVNGANWIRLPDGYGGDQPWFCDRTKDRADWGDLASRNRRGCTVVMRYP